MSNPPVPTLPNITTGATTGRLVTDRYDFQAHVDGYQFRHKAGQIDLFPTLVIASVTKTNVQDALAALAAAVLPPIINDASAVQKGIVQLVGDVSGTATHVIVNAIQGKPINTLTPSISNVLTWDGSSWGPSPATNSFSASGDLYGNNVLQQVIGITGDLFGIIRVSGSVLNYVLGTSPVISQTTNPSGVGSDMLISAQGTTAVSSKGGDLVLSGGTSALGLRGGAKLQLGTSPLVQLAEKISGQRVLSLADTANLTTGNMPAGTGDGVIFVSDAITIPTSGNPSGGTIVYSQGGQLFVKQQDGNSFSVGSIANPSIWGPSGQQTYTHRDFITSTTSTPVTAFSFTLPDLTSTRIDAVIIGKAVGSADTGQFNLSMGYVRNGGAPVAVGTVTNADPRTNGGASGWTIPNITVSGNNILVQTGANTSTTIQWFVVSQLTMSAG